MHIIFLSLKMLRITGNNENVVVSPLTPPTTVPVTSSCYILPQKSIQDANTSAMATTASAAAITTVAAVAAASPAAAEMLEATAKNGTDSNKIVNLEETSHVIKPKESNNTVTIPVVKELIESTVKPVMSLMEFDDKSSATVLKFPTLQVNIPEPFDVNLSSSNTVQISDKTSSVSMTPQPKPSPRKSNKTSTFTTHKEAVNKKQKELVTSKAQVELKNKFPEKPNHSKLKTKAITAEETSESKGSPSSTLDIVVKYATTTQPQEWEMQVAPEIQMATEDLKSITLVSLKTESEANKLRKYSDIKEHIQDTVKLDEIVKTTMDDDYTIEAVPVAPPRKKNMTVTFQEPLHEAILSSPEEIPSPEPIDQVWETSNLKKTSVCSTDIINQISQHEELYTSSQVPRNSSSGDNFSEISTDDQLGKEQIKKEQQVLQQECQPVVEDKVQISMASNYKETNVPDPKKDGEKEIDILPENNTKPVLSKTIETSPTNIVHSSGSGNKDSPKSVMRHSKAKTPTRSVPQKQLDPPAYKIPEGVDIPKVAGARSKKPTLAAQFRKQKEKQKLEEKRKADRLNSFTDDWPGNISDGNKKPSIEVLVEAGFYFVGLNDWVQCLHCETAISGWDENDDPWVRHCQNSPGCSYLLDAKGSEWINHIYKTEE